MFGDFEAAHTAQAPQLERIFRMGGSDSLGPTVQTAPDHSATFSDWCAGRAQGRAAVFNVEPARTVVADSRRQDRGSCRDLMLMNFGEGEATHWL